MLIDDEPAVVEAMERWLRAVPAVRWLGAVRESAAVRAAVRAACPDVVLLDVGLDRDEAFELLGALVSEFPDVRVIMFTGLLSCELVERSLDAGAAGYVLKDNELSELLRLILAGARGEPALCELSLRALRSPRHA